MAKTVQWYWNEIEVTEQRIEAVKNGDTKYTLGDLERYLDRMHDELDKLD